MDYATARSRLVAPQLCNGAFTVGGHHRFIFVECPLHLLLQRRIVLDDEQGFARIRHLLSTKGQLGASCQLAQLCRRTCGVVAHGQQDSNARSGFGRAFDENPTSE